MLRFVLAVLCALTLGIGQAAAQAPPSPPWLVAPITPGDCLAAGTLFGQIVDSGSAGCAAAGAGVTSFSGGSTGLTPATATTGAVTLGATLAASHGGTGSQWGALGTEVAKLSLFGDSITANSDDNHTGSYTGTVSTSSLTIALGTQTLTVATGQSFAAGSIVSIFSTADTANPQNYMQGTVTSYTSGSGVLVTNITNAAGSGTFSSWTVGVIAPITPCTTSCDTYSDLGYGSWLSLYTSNRVNRTPNGAVGTGLQGNFGVPGDTCYDMDTPARINPVIASGAQFVVVQCGTNDIGTAVDTPANMIASLRDIYAQFAAKGITVLRMGIYPVTGWSTTQLQYGLQVNQADQQFYRDGNVGFHFVNLDGVMTDPSQPTWVARSGYLGDGTHPSPTGASAIAWEMAKVINQLVPQWKDGALTNSDLYNAINNPTGNLIGNPAMQGTGGSTGAGCSGIVVTSGVLMGSGGLTCVASVETLPNGAQAQIITVNGTYTGSPIITFAIGTTAGNFNAGDQVQGCAWIRNYNNVTTNVAGFPAVYIAEENSVVNYSVGMYGRSFLYPWPSNGMPVNSFFPVCTPTHTVTTPVNIESMGLWIQFVNGTSLTAAAKVEIAGLELRKVVAP